MRAGPVQKSLAWKIENAADRAAVYLYDVIGEWGITSNDFVSQLRALGNQPLDLHINSAGGDVFEGLAIYNALKNYLGEVTAHIDALAASAASFIAMAGDRVIIAKTASMMIHEAHSFAVGNASDLSRLAEMLDGESQNIAGIYAARTGEAPDVWRERMRTETWYRGQEAVDVGLADEVAQQEPVRAKARLNGLARATIPVNAFPERIVAQVDPPEEPQEEPEMPPEETADLDLLEILNQNPPKARGYEPPLPELTPRLVAAGGWLPQPIKEPANAHGR